MTVYRVYICPVRRYGKPEHNFTFWQKGDIVYMRVTRNYMNSLLGGSNSINNTSSLLQRALSRSSKGRRFNSSPFLKNNKSNKNALFGSTVKSTGNTQKLYYNMKYHAGQVSDYAKKLTEKGEKSLFAKAKESGSTAEVVASIKGFVGQYNSMLQNLKDSGGAAYYNYAAQLNSVSSVNSSELASCGITRNSDGTLSVDDGKLGSADVETLEKVWNGSSFASRTGLWADSIESAAERSMEAKASSSYSNLFNNYGSKGNYFNFFG